MDSEYQRQDLNPGTLAPEPSLGAIIVKIIYEEYLVCVRFF